MYIKKVRKRNKGSDKVYEYLHLVEGVRTRRGPRQRLILNLGKLDIDPGSYKALANSIENRLTGQSELFEEDPQLGDIAGQAVKRIRKKQEKHVGGAKEESETDVRPVDINSIIPSEARSIGGEYVCHYFWEHLGFPDILSEAGIGTDMQKVIEASVIGRLIDPGSERHTHKWAEKRSAVFELIGPPVRYSLDSFYRAGDLLLKHKDLLEQRLSSRQKDIFSLSEKICLFDLTNTYFEGQALRNSKAKYGISKEKRSDCKLLTLALIIDTDGFVKYSRLYAGNQYEGHTLKEMITDMSSLRPDLPDSPTVVLDAGIATEDNIAWLKQQQMSYVVVARGHAQFETSDISDMHVIREDDTGTIQVKRCEQQGETYLLCKSSRRHAKDSGIRSRQEQLFVERLEHMRTGLQRKGCTKRYSKILEMIGRVREKYPRASKIYQVTVTPQPEPACLCVSARRQVPEKSRKAIDITWAAAETYTEELSFEGSYVLRTDRMDLSDKKVWELHAMLTRVESAFRSMKSSLGLRPIFHKKEERSDGHLFISVLAYHILHAIEWKSRSHGDNRFWASIRKDLSTHQRLTVEFDQHTETGVQRHHLRVCTRAEPGHAVIYRNLGLKNTPMPRKMCSF